MNQLQVGDVFAGKYCLEERLGEGTFKETWRAADDIMCRTVALSVWKEETDKERIVAEAKHHAQFEHPHIARIYDAAIDKETDRAYICTELINGPTLQEELAECRPNSQRKNDLIQHILTEIVNALNYAHKRGIVHRDLKPANILLRKTKTKHPLFCTLTGRPKESYSLVLTDWGGSAESGLKAGPVIGADGSMLLRSRDTFDRETGPPTDMYALGVMLYKIITGHYPYEGSTYEALEYKISHTKPKRPSEYPGVKISRSLEKTIMRLLHPDPRKRYTARHLKRKRWWKNNRAYFIGIPCLAAILTGIYLGIISSNKKDSLLFIRSGQLIGRTYNYELPSILSPQYLILPPKPESHLISGIITCAVHENRIFTATKKDIFMNTIKNIDLTTVPSQLMLDEKVLQITKTPDLEETDLKVSPSGNLLAFRLGKNLHVIGTDGTWERKVLENIDEYVWYPQKDQITYRKGDTIYLADTQEAPYAEKSARKIAKGTCPRWASGGKGIWYLREEGNKKYQIVKGYGHSDNVGLKDSREMKTEIDVSIQELFVPNYGNGFAMFTPKNKELLIAIVPFEPYSLVLPEIQNIQELAFDSDARGIAFSGKLTNKHDYEIFYHRIGTKEFIRLTNNQEDDVMPLFISHKSLK